MSRHNKSQQKRLLQQRLPPLQTIQQRAIRTKPPKKKTPRPPKNPQPPKKNRPPIPPNKIPKTLRNPQTFLRRHPKKPKLVRTPHPPFPRNQQNLPKPAPIPKK